MLFWLLFVVSGRFAILFVAICAFVRNIRVALAVVRKRNIWNRRGALGLLVVLLQEVIETVLANLHEYSINKNKWSRYLRGSCRTRDSHRECAPACWLYICNWRICPSFGHRASLPDSVLEPVLWYPMLWHGCSSSSERTSRCWRRSSLASSTWLLASAENWELHAPTGSSNEFRSLQTHYRKQLHFSGSAAIFGPVTRPTAACGRPGLFVHFWLPEVVSPDCHSLHFSGRTLLLTCWFG